MPATRSGRDSKANTTPEPPPRAKRMSGDLEALKAEVQAMKAQIKEYQENTSRQISSFIEEATLDVRLAAFNQRLQSLERNVDIDNGLFNRRLSDLENKMANYEKRFYFDPEVTIIAKDLPATPTEDPVDVADKLIRDGLKIVDVPVVRAKRLESRVQNKPGLLKIEVKDLEAKKKLLKHKQGLKSTQKYSNVYIHSSKSHVERLIELNTNMLLQELPNGHMFRLTANGKLIKEDGYGDRRRHDDRNWAAPPTGPPMHGPTFHGPPQFNSPPQPIMRGPLNQGYHH